MQRVSIVTGVWTNVMIVFNLFPGIMIVGILSLETV